MLFQNIGYEIKILYRSGWAAILALLLFALIGFAAHNGYKKVSQRTDDIVNAKKELAEEDAKMLNNIDLLEKGLDTGLPYWLKPTSPSVVGSRHPRVTAMDAQPFALIATGQSDMYSHFMKPSLFGNNFALDYTEIANPVQLLFGTFDLAFVFIFIIPLLIIALTYDVLSKEKELGTLRIIGAQPISVPRWLIQKLAFRFTLFAVMSILFLFIFMGFYALGAFHDAYKLLLTALLIVMYELFWFVLAGIINLKINQSSKNALVLIGLWLLIVLIIPVTANQIGTSLYPTPSRLKMINEIRQANRDIEKKQDEILDNYLRDHPELAQAGNKEDFSFWHNYIASQKVLKKELQPLLENFDESLKQQRQVVGYFKYLSPAIIMQEALNKMAGTSTEDYTDYKEQVVSFSEEWRNHVIPLLFKGEKYSRVHYKNRPVFIFKPLQHNTFYNILALVLITGGLLLLGSILSPKRTLYT